MSNDHRIVILNGPPRSGKDTAAGFLRTCFLTRDYKMSKPNKDGLKAMFNLSEQEFDYLFEQAKDEPHELLFGKTAREVQISLSEDWAKMFWDRSFFGNMAARRHLNKPTSMDFTVISDCSFVEEAVPGPVA